MRLDLHLHTDRSDGAWSPAELLAAVQRRRLEVWAVTDHDTTAAWTELAPVPGLVPGVELTAWARDREVHVVGLGVDPAAVALGELLAAIRTERHRRAERLLAWIAERSVWTSIPVRSPAARW